MLALTPPTAVVPVPAARALGWVALGLNALLAAGLVLVWSKNELLGRVLSLTVVLSLLLLPWLGRGLDRRDLGFVVAAACYPLLVLLSFAVHGNTSQDEFEMPSRLLLGALLYIWWRRFPPTLVWVRIGALAGVLAAAGYALYAVFVLDIERVDAGYNAIEFAEVVFMLGLLASLPLPTRHAAWLWWLAMAAATLAIVLSQSRGVLLLLPALLWSGWLFRSALGLTLWRLAGVVLSLAVLVGVLYGTGALGRVSQSAPAVVAAFTDPCAIPEETGEERPLLTVAIRAELWRYAADIGAEAGIWGIGKGAFNAALNHRLVADPTCLGRDALTRFHHVHNELLHEWVELGPLGPVALAAFFLIPLLLVFAATRDNGVRYLVVMLALAWLVFGQFQSQMGRNILSLMFVFQLAFITAVAHNRPGADASGAS